jgi:hypothetical protein
VAHVKATKNMVDYLNKCDAEGDIDDQTLPTARPQQQLELGAHSTTKAVAPVVTASASSSATNATYDRLRYGGSSSGPSTSAYGGGSGSHTSGGSGNSSNKQRFLIN